MTFQRSGGYSAKPIYSGCRARQLKVQPGFGHGEFAMDGSGRDIQGRSSLVIGEAAEEQQLDQLALALILLREALQRFVQLHDAAVALRTDKCSLFEGD